MNNLKKNYPPGVVILIIILALCLQPFLSFWIGYFFGWLAKIMIGNSLSVALNTIFHTDYFNPNVLPQVGGALGWIGSFFKNYNSTTTQN